MIFGIMEIQLIKNMVEPADGLFSEILKLVLETVKPLFDPFYDLQNLIPGQIISPLDSIGFTGLWFNMPDRVFLRSIYSNYPAIE